MPNIIDNIKRWKLAKKGLSSGKKRKKSEDDSLGQSLDGSAVMRVLVFIVFIVGMLLLTLQMTQHDIYESPITVKLTEVFFLLLSMVSVFLLNHHEKLPKTRLLMLTFGGLLLQTVFFYISYLIVEKNGWDKAYLILINPYVLTPIVHSVLLGRWLGIYSSVFLAILTGILAPSGMGKEAMIVAMTSGMTAVFFTKNLKKRHQILSAGLISGITALAVAWSLQLIPIKDANGTYTSAIAIQQSAVILGIGCICGLLVGGIMPALEIFFRITTNMTWLELSDLNHKLLRKMQLEAPGTFHHSMVVATLSEAAAESIGANAPLCRVASYFHDIGKIEKPEYFIENQGDNNPHDNLTPNMSALVIIAHVKNGIDLAIRHKLNKQIIDVIQEHHGKSLVYYFYRKALEERESALKDVKEGLKNEEDIPEVSEKGFRYPGPTARTKESGIIALADSIESASRSMKKITLQKIQAMIDEIVNNRIKDGQLNQCPITFEELNTIKDTFANTLRSMLHSRIEYPKDADSSSAKNRKDNNDFDSPRTLKTTEDS